MRRVGCWLAISLAVAIALVLAVFGLLQTRMGQDRLAGFIARTVSSPGFSVAIEGLRGTVPFRMTAAHIEIADDKGVWLSLRNVAVALAPADLLAGTVHIRLLKIAELDMARPSSGPSMPLSEYLRVLHLPIAVVLDRLRVARLTLARPVLGEKVVAALDGRSAVAGGQARIRLDLHRTDGTPGRIALAITLSGVAPKLKLRLDASEPSGLLLDRMLRRTDHPPLTLSLDGAGPLHHWRGRLTAAAGSLARIDANIGLSVAAKTALAISGKAAVAPLLPADLASAVGDRVAFSLHAAFGQRIVVTRLTLGIAAGTIAGNSAFERSNGAITAHLNADMPELAALSGVVGAPLRGSAVLRVGVTGNQSHPVVTADLSGTAMAVSGSGAQRTEIHVSARPTGAPDDPQTRIAIAAKGRIDGLVIPEAGRLAQRIGRHIDWSLAATADRAADAIDLTRFSAEGGGLNLTGSGHLGIGGRTIAGHVDFAGSAVAMRTGIAAVDTLVGGRAGFAGAVSRDRAGAIAVDRLTLTGAGARLSGQAHFDPISHLLAASLTLDVPQLKPLGAALGAEIGGAASARVKVQGPLDRLRLHSVVDGRDIIAGGAAIERFRLSGDVADLSRRKAVIDGSFRMPGLVGSLALSVELNGNSELVVQHLRVQAADSTIDGDLRVALATGLAQGSLAARLPDLSRWSGLAGRPLGGSLDLNANLSAQGGGQGLELSVTGARLAAGLRYARVAIGRLAATARLADIWRTPSGTGRVSLGAARLGAADFTTAAASFSSPRPGRFGFQANAQGRPLTVALAGEGGLAPGGGAELRLTRLAGSLDGDQFRLAQPLELTRRGADLAFSNLDLRLGAGRITGNGAVRGETLALAVNAADLPVATGARLIGYPNVHGSLSLAANLGGTLRAPRGHLVLNAQDLSFAVSRHASAPRLGLSVEGDWNGRSVDMQGRVTGLAGDRMSVTGSLPLLLTAAPLGLSVPSQGRLALQLRGSGEIGHLADLLPLGEDRLSGRFAADVAVGGTVAAPAASGRLRLSGGRYENFTTGAVLTHIDADLVGDRDRFDLAAFSADDGASGTLRAQGSLMLSGASGPSAQLSATLADFRVAARDEALVTASGTISIAGPLTALRVTAPLTVDRAEINLPNSLPPSVVVLHVTEIGGRARKSPAPAEAAPAIAAALDVTLAMPGPVVVRGHGLDSQWHGRLEITGTSAAHIAGALSASRGSVDLLGKSFRLTRGTITFDGSARLDPALDIVAEASAADITARVIISGFASAPKITLASTPPLPRDEILSRVLFNSGVGQMTAGEGLELAQAAATLAGGGPDVLDRLRSGLGLDWLRFGQGPAGAASPILNPSVVTPGTSSATAVSAGKYIMPGVSVGVTQGVSPPTSKVTVEIDVGHHVTVDTEAGQNGGTGIGLNYNYDY